MDPVLEPTLEVPPTNSNNEPTPPADPPTNQPAVLPPELLSAYNATITDRTLENQRLREQLRELQESRNAPPKLTPEESSKKFFEDPVQLIRSEIDRALQPLNESFAKTQRETQYQALKARMKQDPRFSDLDKVEGAFDLLMRNQPLDENLMISVYYATYGKAVKDGTLSASTPNPTPATPVVVTPPHLRPTAPSAPVNPPKVALRPLNENEETVRRYNRMTHEEYLRGMGEIK